MKFRPTTTITALAVLVVSLFTGAASADAAIISMQFTGTVSTVLGSGPVFGESGSVPFDFAMTYDTLKGSEVAFVAAGVGPDDLWGYSAAGITAVSMTFGTKTWTLDDLQPTTEKGQTAAFWTNTDLTVAAPGGVQILFGDADSSLLLGGVFAKGGFQSLFRDVSISERYSPEAFYSMTGEYELSTSVAPAAVPEPASLLLLGSGLVGFAAHRRSSKRRSPVQQR